MNGNSWAILTGEYPPAPGGVADYSAQVAAKLAQRGQTVHVFAPSARAPFVEQDGVAVHALPDHFGLRSLAFLSRELDALHYPRILVQYVPHAFGWRAMNLPFCLWLHRRSARQEIWTMFHEVSYPFRHDQPMRHQVIALTNRVMATLVAAASQKVFVAISAWARLLENLGVDPSKVVEAPIPSNLPICVAPDRVAAVARERRSDARFLIGHFGTFQPMVAELLNATLPTLLAPFDRRALLVGRGSREYAEALCARHSNLRDRVDATGELYAQDAAAHLATCDLLLQPYPDGISGRRGTTMAGLALGLPIVSNLGALSEDWWTQARAVGLAASPDPKQIVARVEELLANDALMKELARNDQRLYADRFEIERTIDKLLQPD